MKQLLFLILTISTLQSKTQNNQFETSEWKALQQNIGYSTIVGLGEISHGIASINEAKSILIKFLYRQMYFHAIAFESSFTESVVGFIQNDSAEFRPGNFLYPFWNTPTIQTVIKEFLKEEYSSHKPLLIGFDIQEDCRFVKFSEYLNGKGLIIKNKSKLLLCDSILSFYIGKNFTRNLAMTRQECDILINNYNQIASELREQINDSVQQKLLQRCITNRKSLCRYLAIRNISERMYYRDSMMADNIQWLKNEFFIREKLILWAANTHIAKQNKNGKPAWMGEWISNFYPNDYYAVSVKKGSTKSGKELSPGMRIEMTKKKEPFDAIIILQKTEKIRPQEWITNCE